MKAIVYTEYGTPQVLHVQEVATPTPKDGEVLIKIHATSINYGDLLARNFKNMSSKQFNMPFIFWLLARVAFGLNRPNKAILGSEFSGEIVALGNGVTQYKVGDHVFGYRGDKMGTYAEYLAMPATATLSLIPHNISHEQAATIPYGAIMAVGLLQKANIQRGQKVLINGASGGIGSVAIQIAKHYYGAEVTGVCSTPRLNYVKTLGADAVIDYTREDFTKNGKRYDVILDVLGKTSYGNVKNSLTATGRVLYASFKSKQLFDMIWASLTGRKNVLCVLTSESAEILQFIKTLVEEGKLTAIVDRSFDIDKAPEAHRYAENGQRAGGVVIRIAPTA